MCSPIVVSLVAFILDQHIWFNTEGLLSRLSLEFILPQFSGYGFRGPLDGSVLH